MGECRFDGMPFCKTHAIHSSEREGKSELPPPAICTTAAVEFEESRNSLRNAAEGILKVLDPRARLADFKRMSDEEIRVCLESGRRLAADLERRVAGLLDTADVRDRLIGVDARHIRDLKTRLEGFAECYKNAWHGFQMIRETLETLGPVGAVKSEEGVVKELGPEPVHEAEALVEAIRTLESRLARLEEERDDLSRRLEKMNTRHYALSEDFAQAEAREAAMRGALEKVRLRFKEFWDDRYVAICDAALSPDAGRALTEECEVCHGKAFWLSKEGAEIPCERCGHLSKTAVYFIAVEPDGTWLILNGGRRRAAIRLEDAAHGPIVKAAIAEVRYALGKRGKEGGE